MNIKNIFILLVVLIVGIGVGMFAGKTLLIGKYAGEVERLQSQIDHAKTFLPPTAEDVRAVHGLVKGVEGSTVIVETQGNPFEGSPSLRRVTVGDNTKIIRNAPKDPALLAKEVEEYRKRYAANPSDTSLVPPSPFNELSSDVSDVAAGQWVIITAEENIRDAEFFTALKIIITGSASGE